MDEQQRDEPEDEFLDPSEILLPLESVGPPLGDDDVDNVSPAEGMADEVSPPEIMFSGPNESAQLLTREIEGLKHVPSLETGLRIEPSTGDAPHSAQEAILGRSPAPGRLNVGFQPHARKVPIAYEPQPSFETPEDEASKIAHAIHNRGEDSGKPHDLVYRYGDPDNKPRVQLMSEGRQPPSPGGQAAGGDAADEESASQSSRAQTLPRLLITVSMANARSVFQDCIERASKTLGAKFHAACQSTVNDYARDRRAAERAANRYG